MGEGTETLYLNTISQNEIINTVFSDVGIKMQNDVIKCIWDAKKG